MYMSSTEQTAGMPCEVRRPGAVVVRQAELDSDRDQIIEVLSRFLTPLSSAHRFDWLYKENPYGPARVWMALEEKTGTVIGAAAAFPRKMYVGGVEKLGWVLGDFCVSDRYRTLGPALQLQRACLTVTDTASVTLCYDFPSRAMTAVYKRLGIEPFGQIRRFAKPLRADRKIREWVPWPSLAGGASAAANWILALADRRWEEGHGWTLALHEGPCGQEFTDLARQARVQYAVCIQRSAEYLNWRYLAHPFLRFEILTLRRNSSLRGYAVFTQSRDAGSLVDLFGVQDEAAMSTLLVGLVTLLRQRRVATVSVRLLDSHPWVALLTRLGFRPRESSPLMVYPPGHAVQVSEALKGQPWFLMHGDRDS